LIQDRGDATAAWAQTQRGPSNQHIRKKALGLDGARRTKSQGKGETELKKKLVSISDVITKQEEGGPIKETPLRGKLKLRPRKAKVRVKRIKQKARLQGGTPFPKFPDGKKRRPLIAPRLLRNNKDVRGKE